MQFSSYKEAMAALQVDHKLTAYWDAGEGWKAEAYWHRGRLIQVSINPDGLRIV